MPSQKISGLTSYTTPLAADLIPIVDTANTATKQISIPNLLKMSSIPLGVVNSNTARQSQVVVSATNYYLTNSGLTVPTPIVGMSTSTRFYWRFWIDKTAAGTGAFQISIYRGTNGSTADTQDVLQTIGTQTGVVDVAVVDVSLAVTTTGATGAYYWSMSSMNQASTAATPAGFGNPFGTTGIFSGTVSSVAMNTAALIFGIGVKFTTGTPTFSVPYISAWAVNLS